MLFIGPTLLSGIGQVVKKYQSLYQDSKYIEYGVPIEKDTDVFVFALPIPDVINYLITVKQQARKIICMTVCETETVHELYGELFKLFSIIHVPSEYCQIIFSKQFPETKFEIIRHHVPLIKEKLFDKILIKNINPKIVELIEKCLTIDPNDRITLDEALNHDFILL